MLEKKIEKLIHFGTGLRYLQDVKAGYRIRMDEEKAWYVLNNITAFLQNLEELSLSVTRRASYELVTLKEQLEKSPNERVSTEEAERLAKIMRTIRPTLEAEARGMIAYIISERRYRIESLIDDPASLFASGVYERLPELAKQDFNEATKCLAFERPTAAAFHMLRGTESILREYYCLKVKRKRAALMWGPMIQSMKSFPKRFPTASLNHLDHIRSSFRNPTAHPEKMYDIDEAQDLLAICLDVANRMIQDQGE